MIKIFLILTIYLLASAGSKGFHVPLKQRQVANSVEQAHSFTSETKPEGSLGAPLLNSTSEVQTSSKSHRDGSPSISLENYNDFQYEGELLIGSKEEHFTFNFDT